MQGASTGLGFAIAQSYSEEGAKVVICSANKERITYAASKIQGSIPLVINLDLPSQGKILIEQAINLLGGVDILVTNTGGPPKGDFSELTLENWEQGYRRLLQSAVDSIQAALIPMKEQKFGRIILSTSTAAKEPIAHLTISNCFRAGLLGLMKTVSTEVAPYNITVNSILPGYTQTARLAEIKIPEEKLLSQIPMGRFGSPEEFGALATFLGSTQASYITGQAIACDGGLIKGI